MSKEQEQEKDSVVMVDAGPEIQIICKVLTEKSLEIIHANNIDETFFEQFKDLFNFIVDHHKQYAVVPDMSTIANEFRDVTVYDVLESEDYLVNNLYEQKMFRKTYRVIESLQPVMLDDANKAVEMLMQAIPSLTEEFRLASVDLIQQAPQRYEQYKNLSENYEDIVIPTGFNHIDEQIGGWKPVELGFILGRPNNGKSWLLVVGMVVASMLGKRCGFYSGEMPAIDLGYRYDTVYHHISNTCLQRGNKAVDFQYKKYTDELVDKDFFVRIVTQKEFGGKPTVAKLENFIVKEKLDILFIDQLSLLKDQRKSRDRRLSYENICTDLLELTMRYEIPIVCAVQANRMTSQQMSEEPYDLPRLENIAESDAIGQIATKVLSMCQHEGRLIIKCVKNRNLGLGEKAVYDWQIDKGIFEFNEDGTSQAQGNTPPSTRTRRGIENKKEVF